MKLRRSIDATALLPDVDHASLGLPLSVRGSAYYRATTDVPAEDLSFAYMNGERPAMIVACTRGSGGTLDRFGFPIEIWCDPKLPDDVLLRLSRDVGGELATVARGAALDQILLRAPAEPRLARYLAARYTAQEQFPEATFPIAFDLRKDDAVLLAACRSGHRQQIRAGIKSYALEFVDANRPDRAGFNRFQQLHAEVAGRVTRPQASWDAMFDMVAHGEGDLALTYVDGVLLGGTLMLDAGNTSYYASGAYVRSHFDKPLAHFPLYTCLCRARDRGRLRAHLGETGASLLAASDKEKSISHFKMGFTSEVESSLVWKLPVP